jgi:hypothetical protein
MGAEKLIFLHDLFGRPVPVNCDVLEYRLGRGRFTVIKYDGADLEVKETVAEIEALIKAL